MSDLLVPGWGCKLSASAPALDNYPLECLVRPAKPLLRFMSVWLMHTQIERRGPGFIAERFVKPPVDIVVEFPYASSLFVRCASEMSGEGSEMCLCCPPPARLRRCA